MSNDLIGSGGMTENEAVEVIKRLIGISPSERIVRAVETAISALKEIQQYRSIGTVSDFRKLTKILNEAEADTLSKTIDEWITYQKIGSVEECREAVEKQRAKKPRICHYGKVQDRGKAYCPNCGLDIHGRGMIGACFRCGQLISWERDNE